ncbi:hypothetical protein MUG84_00165 [Paenibacillus sp. KQZ6P-2]|uniref:Uncharacterized protein n=1 Tax=Paenibacillus mangrovi TaxID=2931978 RepID=A0A9X2B060_9BACL|nr:hypothetical protein [Paenibacillus mangrovi]MCJ8010154.1 hypothetical protein [Paenibacillus mangrovi]
MGNNYYKILGAIFMIISGLIYTAERIIENLSAALVAAGYASHGTGTDRAPNYAGFFDNFFVWFFFLLGFLLLAYGFPKGNK